MNGKGKEFDFADFGDVDEFADQDINDEGQMPLVRNIYDVNYWII
jgi:hypothetical protein